MTERSFLDRAEERDIRSEWAQAYSLISIARTLGRIAVIQEQNAVTQERIQIALENITEIMLKKTP